MSRRAGDRSRGGRVVHTGVEKPDWPRVGDLVRYELTIERRIIGLVVESTEYGWGAPVLRVLADDGSLILVSSPKVQVLSRRRRSRGSRMGSGRRV